MARLGKRYYPSKNEERVREMVRFTMLTGGVYVSV